MNIRKLAPQDVEAYRALRLLGLQTDPTAFGSSYEEEAAYPLAAFAERLQSRPKATGFALGAWDGDQLVGTATLMRQTRLKTDHNANVYGVYVAPAARGRGVARALMEAVVAEARAMEGVTLVKLGVVVGNVAARGLYRSLGFVSYGVEPQAIRVDGVFYDEEYLALSLGV